MATMDQIFAGYRDRMGVLEATYDKNPFARGFMHSDLTYDVPSVWDGRFFRLDEHLARLQTSCKKLRLQLPFPKEEVKRILVDMVSKSGIRDAFVELIVTRGLKGVRGSEPGEVFKNNLYMFIQPFVWVIEPEMQPTGGKAVVARTGDLTCGLFEAADRGALYPFLTDGDANLTPTVLMDNGELIGEHGSGGGTSGDEIDRYDIENGSPRSAITLATSIRHSDDFGIAIEDLNYLALNTLGIQTDLIRSDVVYCVGADGGGVLSVGSINRYSSTQATRTVINKILLQVSECQ
uniref:Putative branched-chain-amino-acid aminotransferase n=1 Tax=Talaromyces marneffei PM1 TaxID=1077442 RepID=A0A093UZ71_TALMA